MLAAKSSVGVTPEVNLRNPLCTGNEHASNEIHPGFETQGRSHLKPKTWVSVAAQKELMSSKYFLKEFRYRSAEWDSTAYRKKLSGLAVFDAEPA